MGDEKDDIWPEWEPDPPEDETRELELKDSIRRAHNVVIAAYDLFKTKTKLSRLPKALEYIEIAAAYQQELKEKIQAFHSKPVEYWDIGREETVESESIYCAKFFARYLQLLLVDFSFHNSVVTDFHFVIGPNERHKMEELKELKKQHIQTAKTTYQRLKEAKNFSDLYVSNSFGFEEREYTRGKKANYFTHVPPSAVTDDDLLIMKKILKKSIHWCLFSHADAFLFQEEPYASKTGARKIDTQIADINDGYIEDFYKLFFVLGITVSDSAKIIKQCLEVVNTPIKIKYEGTEFAESFVYAKATIEDKIKGIKPKLEKHPLKELIPQN